MVLAINRLVSQKSRTHVCGAIRMLCTKHLLQRSAVERRWRSACGTAEGRSSALSQGSQPCVRNAQLEFGNCGSTYADGLASWLGPVASSWQDLLLLVITYVLRMDASHCDFAVVSFRLKASVMDLCGACPTSYN